MRRFDLASLVFLSAIWGGSYLFMRVASPEFGPLSLMLMRVGIAAVCLAPLLASRGNRALVREHAGSLLLLGVINSALPFTLLAYATLTLEAGFTALLNATTPLFTSMVAAVWLRQGLGRYQFGGLALGFAGVGVLAWDKLGVGEGDAVLAIGAVLLAAVSYGFAGNVTRLRLSEVPPEVTTVGAMLAATLVLLPLGVWRWPGGTISGDAWWSAVALGLVCTAVGFFVYYRLIARAGALAASTVTFLVPIFAALWGLVFLGEGLTPAFGVGLVLTLAGTAFTVGLLPGSELRRKGLPAREVVSAGEEAGAGSGSSA